MDADTPAEGPPDTRVARAARGVGGPMSFLVASAVLVDEESLLILEMDVEPKMLRDAVLGPLSGVLSLLRPPVMNGCRIAVWGLSLLSGSQIRHLEMKSTNSASSHRNTELSVLVPGRLRRPLEFTTGRGAPEESTNSQYIYHVEKKESLTKEDSSARATLDNILVRDTQHFHDAGKLLLLVLPRENREASVQLCKNATKTPHVDRHAVTHSKNDFWRAIESTLNVCIYCAASVSNSQRRTKKAHLFRARGKNYQSLSL